MTKEPMQAEDVLTLVSVGVSQRVSDKIHPISSTSSTYYSLMSSWNERS